MKWVRLGLLGFAAFIAVTLVLQHFGFMSGECNQYCGAIRDWPPSKLISLTAVAGIGTLGWAVWTNKEQSFLRWSIVGVVVSGAMQIVAAMMEGVCPSCMGLAFLFGGLALTNVAVWRIGYLGALVGAFGIYVNFYDAIMNIRRPEPTSLVLRTYESSLAKARVIFVIVADPECPACRALSLTESENNTTDITIVYRWWLLPASSARTLRAAVAIEGVSEQNWEKGIAFRRALFAVTEPLTDQVILGVARSTGVYDAVEGLLRTQPEHLLGWIAQDGRMCESARVNEVPYVFEAAGHERMLGHSSVKVIESFAKREIRTNGEQ